MKRSIVPVVSAAMIVALIVVFAMVGCKESMRYDDVRREQSDNNESKRQSVSDAVPKATLASEKGNAIVAPIAEPKPAESKSAAKMAPAIDKPAAANATAAKKSAAVVPSAISSEKAKHLSGKQEKDREEAQKLGWVLREEKFISLQKVSPDIQQTASWKYVAEKDQSKESPIAKKQRYFSVKSKVPLEYVFSQPLYEYTIYQYSLYCRVKGNGKVILSCKGGKAAKEFSINSKLFETISYSLGDGKFLDRALTPSITFQGDLQVQSITLRQKEINPHRTICLGRVESISKVPDIKNANYPDCYYTAKFVIKDILDGNSAPQNIQLLIPAFLNNKIDPLSTRMKQGNWKVSIRPFSFATKKEQEIEQVDEIESYQFTPYILVAASAIGNIPELTVSAIPILEGENYVSPFDNPVNPPLPARYMEISKREIEKELAKVNRIVEQAKDDESINAEFQSAWNKKQKAYDLLEAPLYGKYYWAKEHNSFFAMPQKWSFIQSSKKIPEGNVDAVVELNRLFRSQGIQFIIQIVPDFRDIAALVLNPEFQKYGDQRSARAAKQLLERGVEVQYISDELVKNAFKYERMFFYPYNFHPDEGTMDIMTTMMARRIEKHEDLVPKKLKKELFSKENRDTGCGKNLTWPKNVDTGSHEPGSVVQVPYVLYDKQEIWPNPLSNILVFGNSFAMEPMRHDAYIAYLAPKILHICSCRVMGGSSALTALPQLFLSYPDKYLKNKRLAILPIPILYLSEKRYSFPNVSNLDAVFKSQCKSVFLAGISLKEDCCFTSSFVPVPSNLVAPLRIHPSASLLSKKHPKILLKIPDDFKNAKTVRISILPCQEMAISLSINGEPYRLPSQYVPKWEILEAGLNGRKEISIEINCDLGNPAALVGNVSLFQ